MNPRDVSRCIRVAGRIESGIEALEHMLREAGEEKTVIELEEALYNMHRAARCCWTLGATWTLDASTSTKCRRHANDHLEDEVHPENLERGPAADPS